jgi:hypothetical protein
MKNCFLGLMLAFAGLVMSEGSVAQASPSTAIVSLQNNQCWDVVGFSTADGAVIQLYPCTGTSNQAWAFQVYGFSGDTRMARIVNVGSGMCAAIEDANPASGAIGLRQRVCNVNDPLQQFYVQAPIQTLTISTTTFPAPLLALHITSVASHWCISMDPSFYRPVEVSTCGDANNARWKFAGV